MSSEQQPALAFTELFFQARRGNHAAANLVYKIALPRLREIARRLIRTHPSRGLLQPTELAGELFLKLRGFRAEIFDREHFFRLSARAMKQVLIDLGRCDLNRRRREAEVLESFRQGLSVSDREDRLIAIDILQRFEKTDCKTAKIIRLRYFEDLSWQEISNVTGREVWRLRDDVQFALEWMQERLI